MRTHIRAIEYYRPAHIQLQIAASIRFRLSLCTNCLCLDAREVTARLDHNRSPRAPFPRPSTVARSWAIERDELSDLINRIFIW
jgi:hypothetical protein